MALTVNKPTHIKPRAVGLTALGKALLVAFVLLAMVAVIAVMAGQANERARAKAAQPIDDAVAYVLTVAKQTATALGTDADLQRVADSASFMEREGDPLKRAEAAQTLLGDMLALAQGNQAAIDEINGAKNRIHIAVRGYQNN